MAEVGGHPNGHGERQTDVLGRSIVDGELWPDMLGHSIGHGRVLSVKRVAELTGLSERQVRRLCETGRYNNVFWNSRYWIDPASVPGIGDVADLARSSSEPAMVHQVTQLDVARPARAMAEPGRAEAMDDDLWRILRVGCFLIWGTGFALSVVVVWLHVLWR
jgi:hypothetical protein